MLWKNYMNLVRIEESFRTLKSDLGLRRIHHQLLLNQLQLTLPDQPPPEIRSPADPVVETF